MKILKIELKNIIDYITPSLQFLIKLLIIFLLLLSYNFKINAQKTWDGGAGTNNWGDANNWNPNGVPTATDNVTISNNGNLTINVNGNFTCNNLTIIYSGNINGTIALTIPSGGSLTANNINLSNFGNGGENATINISGGTLNCNSITMQNTNNDNSDCYILLSNNSSILNVTNSITMNGNNLRNYLYFTANGTINVGGTITGGGITSTSGGGAAAPTSGTVVYNNNGPQTIGAYTYFNLTITGGGTKVLTGNVTVNNILNLQNGNISLGSSNYNLTIGPNGSITGSFDQNHMIVCDGTGSLIKQGTNASSFVMVFPVGTGTRYTPFEITSLTATVAGTGSISVRAVADRAPGPPAANLTDLQKYWLVSTTNLSNISANIRMTYIIPDEVGTGGDQSTYQPYLYSSGSWILPSGASSPGINPMTVTGTNVLAGQWTAREGPKTYYSYQSGDWNNPTVWTLDPSGTLYVNPSSAIPGAMDRVVILNGRTITTSTARSVLSLQINEGGTLDIGSSTGHNFGEVRGKGLLRLSTATFPGGTFTEFVSFEGGTVEYYNNANFNFTQYTYNNLILNLNQNIYIATVVNNMTINGDLTVLRGIFQVNDASTTARTVTIQGNVLIESQGSITLGTGNTNHTIYIRGNITNNGSVDFYEGNAPDYLGTNYATTAHADVIFDNGTADQYLYCNGRTEFYRIVIDKGIDQTYVLHIDASAPNLFFLYGRNNQMGVTPTPGPPNIVNLNALGLQTGTVRLGANINIPSLASENNAGDDLNYHVDEDACLWIDGATVTHTTLTSNSFVLYGKLKITNPTSVVNINTNNAGHGIVMREKAAIEIHDGQLIVPCIRTSTVAGTHRGSYTQTGGTVRITGNIEGSNVHPSLSMTYPEMVFKMSGGTLIIEQATDDGAAAGFSLVLGMNPQNVSIEGGTIQLNIQNRNADFTSTIPFWNLIINSNSNFSSSIRDYPASGSSAAVSAQPLVVLNNFVLNGTSIFNTNNQNVTIGHDFTIASGATYNPGTNTTIFNGNGGQLFTNNGTITNGLYNLTITNKSNTNITQNLTVRNNLTIDADCYLQDMGRTISVSGNIINSGTHISQAAGSITVTGTNNQTIGGNGNGIFGNLTINKTGGTISMISNQRLNGNLRLASNSIFDIGIYRLTLSPSSNIYDALTGTGQNFSNVKMIRTAGNLSDGGITKEFNSIGTFLYPFGTNNNYTPATIQFSQAPTTWGKINIKPVNRSNPFITSTNALQYYWKTSSEDFVDIAPNSVTHTYEYVDVHIVGTEANYIPGVYRPYSWTYINDISKVIDANNLIRFENLSEIDGEYTAGEISAFQTVKVFYSRQNGNWNDVNTWSSVGVGGPVDGSLPGPNNPVVIGDGNSINHTVTVTNNNIVIGGLEIRGGSTLDLGTTTGHNFGALPESKVRGNGLLRISSAVATASFPGGDFGYFLSSEGGTVEYYTTGNVDFTLPAGISNYNNLIITPSAGRVITLPNTDLTIYNDLSINGSGIVRLNSAAVRNLNIYGNLNVNSGILRFMNNNLQTVTVYKDVIINSGATFDVNNAGTSVANRLNIYGNLINNGTFDMFSSATLYCNVYFYGNENKEISGTGTNEFNILYINKGTDRNTILSVTANNLTISGSSGASSGLVLNYGTFRVSNANLNFTLATTSSFTIPISAALSVDQGTVNIGTTSNNGDLILNGRLEVINNGRINIGISGQDYNNDIEYASGGNPEIIVDGNGYLFVNGQIRRPTTVTTGSLYYSQRGNSTVVIDGRAAVTSRAMFEILNNGTFEMTGGNIIISRNYNNNLYNELILNPANYNITGGTIRLGSSAIASNNTVYNIITSSPLWNLIVDATSTTKIVNLRVFPLTILNNLIIEGNSEFRANGLNVTIGGNLVNNNLNSGAGIATGGYQPGSLNQTTIFNGNAKQFITGNGANLTNFANLVIDKSDTLVLNANSNIRVNNKLTLLNGTLNDGGQIITVVGNIENNSVHYSPLPGGKIVLGGTTKQIISGNGSGTFGNIELNNSLGFDMVDNSIFNGIMTFTLGNLYIDDYNLIFGPNATIAGNPSSNSMIVLNGVISDLGVTKYYNGAADFTFPVGVHGKYTPARINVLSTSSPGTITVRPINYKHPALYNGGTANYLDYYWYVTSTGFSNPVVQHYYYYLTGDVNGNESSYVAGRYYNYQWNPQFQSTDNTIDYTNNIIQILPSSGVNYIDGEYTAGDPPNFNNIPIYYSRNATQGGNWTDPNSWTLNADGSGGPAPSYPQGNPVVILPGHTITMNANSQYAYSVEINGNLNIGTTLYHNLGHISGGGKLQITSTTPGTYGIFVFPGGEYDAFMSNPTSTIELTNNSAIPAFLPLKPGNDYKPYQNVIFSGNGIKYISAENIKVSGNLYINGGTLNNTMFHKNVTILGNWTDNVTTATGGFVPGKGTVYFNGLNTQQLVVSGGSTVEQFYNLVVDNGNGVVLSGGGQVSVSNKLYLTNGNITTNNTNLLTITNSSPLAVVGGGSSSFVNGPLRKYINAGSYFEFPVGDNSRYGNIYISMASTTGYYIAQYYNHNPGNDGFDPYSKISPIDVVSNNEYWRINGPTGATAYVRIRWDSQSGIIPSDPTSRTKLRIVEWNGTAWENRGNVINDGGVNYGTIQTSTVVSIAGNHYFTIGVESLPTAIIISGNSSICDDGSSTNIVIELTGVAPWTIKYKVNGAYETTISNIAISPYTLVVSNAIEPIASGGPGDYVFNISYVRDATGSTGVRDFTKTVTITVYESPNPVISGNTTAAIGETNVIYSTPYVPGHTYLWSYGGPPGTTHNGSLTSNTLSINWGNQAGTGWVRVTETVTIGGCSKTTNYYYVTITDIPNPDITGPTSVCNYQTVTYRTPKVGTHTYLWSLPLGGGTIIGSNTLDSVVVQWTSDGIRRVRVVETGSEPREDNLDVTVNPLPPNTYTVSDPAICEGNVANIIVYSTAPGLSLQLRDNSNNNPVGLPVSTGPGGNVTINASPTITTVYNILVTNEYNCSQQLNDLSTVTVYPRPIPTISEGTNICQGETVVYTTESGKTNYIWVVTNVDPTAGHQIISGGGSNNNSITIRWTGYERHRISVSYTDENGCTPYVPTSYDVWVIKLPQTGPIYHLRNSPW